MPTSDEFKAQGNAAFAQGQYEQAEDLYSKAIAEDPSNHVLFGNRSATRLPQNKYDAALEDADQAIKLDPSWVKGYYRRGMAQIELQLWRDAAESFGMALEKQPKNSELHSRLTQVLSKMRKHERESPVKDIDHWIKIWGSLSNMRERLHSLACFWNEATQKDRHAVFSRFLEVIAGSGKGATGADFPVETMMPLPMDNYADLDLPAPWLSFYQALDSEGKLSVFERMYAMSTTDEQNMIVKDLKFFILAAAQGGGEDGGVDEVDLSTEAKNLSLE
jgi:tetratricopeptide (TPR) repeat protein